MAEKNQQPSETPKQRQRRLEQETKQTQAKAEAEKARAAADAEKAKAETEARRAEVELEKAKLDAADKQRQSEAQKRKDDNAPTELMTKLALNFGAPLAGLGLGYGLSKVIENRYAATLVARRPELNALAKQASGPLSVASRFGADTKRGEAARQKLAGIVKTADGMGLTKLRGPLGLATAGIVLAEGAFSRFVLAPTIENPIAREAANAVGTVSLFAGSALIAERALHNSTPKSLPGAKELATIETARNAIAKPEVAQAAGKSLGKAIGQKVLRAIPIAGPLLLAGAAGVMAGSEAAEAGESTGDVAKKGGYAAGDVLSFGALSTYDERRAKGDNQLVSGVRATAEGAFGLFSFGVGPMLRDQAVELQKQAEANGSYDPAAAAAAETGAFTGATMVEPETVKRTLSVGSSVALSLVTRKLVQSAGRSKSFVGSFGRFGLALTTGTMAVGAGMHALGISGANAAEAGKGGPATATPKSETKIAMRDSTAGERAWDATKTGMAGVLTGILYQSAKQAMRSRSPVAAGVQFVGAAGMGIMTAAMGYSAVTGRTTDNKATSQGKAYLNDAAAKKAQTPMPAATPRQSTGTMISPNGRATKISYTTIDNKTVTVTRSQAEAYQRRRAA